MFIWAKDDLNDEQEIAINAKGNIFLVACPGSGKTRTLTYKIALELSKLRSSKNVVIAITYTHSAADEIKDRIELMGVDISQLWIGTIHAFCYEWILKPYGQYTKDLKYGFQIINPQDSEELLTELCAPFAAHRITHFDCSYVVTPQNYKLLCPQFQKHTHIHEILANYWEILLEKRLMDFEMILRYSYDLLEGHKFISKILSKIFSYILIDEYQDTKEIQYTIFSYIFRAGNDNLNAFIVGDPNQAIYTTLGGYAISKANLEALTGKAFQPLSLSGNYRSSSLIINYFDYFKTFPNSIIGCGVDKDYQSVISFNDQVQRKVLEDEIVRLILFNVEHKGISPNEICIVGPQWVHLASITRSLMVRLPDYSFNGPGMAPFAKDIDNFFYKVRRIVLTEPSPNMYVRRLRWSAEILQELENFGLDLSHISRKLFLKFCNSIKISENDGITYLKEFFKQLFALLKIDIKKQETLTAHYESFFKSSESRISKLVKDGYEYISTTENFRKVFKQKDGITISTIHGVKGTEYDTVIAFALLQDYVPHFYDPNGDDSAKKLLYVIGSRAKKNLHLISERGRVKPFGSPPPELVTTHQLSMYNFGYHTFK